MSDLQKDLDFYLETIISYRPRSGLCVMSDVRRYWMRDHKREWPFTTNRDAYLKNVLIQRGELQRVAHGLFRIPRLGSVEIEIQEGPFRTVKKRDKKVVKKRGKTRMRFEDIDFNLVSHKSTFTLKDLMPLASTASRHHWSLRLISEGKLIKIRKNKYQLPQPETQTEIDPALLSALRSLISQETQQQIKSLLRDLADKI